MPFTYCGKGGFPLCEYRLPEIKEFALENKLTAHRLPSSFINMLSSVVKTIDSK
jgi:hypothetical protein